MVQQIRVILDVPGTTPQYKGYFQIETCVRYRTMKRRDHIKRMAKMVQTDQGQVDDTLQRITTLNIERNPTTHSRKYIQI